MRKVSRKPLVILTAVCFLLSGVLIPVGAHLPRWVEAEVVLSVWWLVWVVVMAWMLFYGFAVDDDINTVAFRSGRSHEIIDPVVDGCVGCGLGGGCDLIFWIAGALLLSVVAIFFLVEFILPAVALILLASVGGMLARAVNDRQGCYGRAGLSLLWGAIWSTLYIGPAAAIILWLATFFPRR